MNDRTGQQSKLDEVFPRPRLEAAPPSARAAQRSRRQISTVALPPDHLGNTREITFLTYGVPGHGPKVYMQAGLHADEFPGMLVLHELAALLDDAAARGAVTGEIILAPAVNPIGLGQRQGGFVLGRNEARSDENFNRGFKSLAPLISARIGADLGADAPANVSLIRKTMREIFQEERPCTPLEELRRAVHSRACDADIVLDLHADNEAQMHLYTGGPLWPAMADLAADIDARAVLLAENSGGEPFDEACSALWWTLAAMHPRAAIPQACQSATVELRSNNEVDQDLAERDARALFRFLMRRGVVDGEPGPAPRLLCDATRLDAMQQLRAPSEGLLLYHARLGDSVREGELIAEIVAPLAERHEIRARTTGVLFARHDQRYAWAGKVIGKIAGSTALPERTGDLLTP